MSIDTHTDVQRNKRFDARVPEHVYSTIKRAAELQGRSMTDYVMGIAYADAQAQIERIELINLSRESSELVAQMLITPPPQAPAMARAVERHRELFDDK